METVFGVIKEVLGFRRFHLRGLRAPRRVVSGVQAWNLKRLHVLVADRWVLTNEQWRPRGHQSHRGERFWSLEHSRRPQSLSGGTRLGTVVSATKREAVQPASRCRPWGSAGPSSYDADSDSS